MGSLNSIKLISRDDLLIGGTPINKVISNKMTSMLKDAESENGFALTDDTKLCGTITWTDKDTVDHIADSMNLLNYLAEQEKNILSKVSKDVNEYLEKKVSEFCKINNVSFIDWSKNGQLKQWKNKTEYYYNDYFVCGVEIIQDELIPEDFKLKKTLLLRYY